MVEARRTAVVIGSVGIHAIAIALISRCELERPPPRPPAPSIDPPPVEVATSEPIGLALVAIAPGTVHELSATSSAAASAAGPRLGRGFATTGRSGGEPRPATGGESLRMRGRRHDLALSGDALDRILAATEPLVPIATDERLLPNGGTHVIPDRVTTVTVDKDGNAHFKDKHDIDPKLTLPIMTFQGYRTQIGATLTAWYADPYRDQRAGRVQDLPRHLTAVPGACESFGDPMCDTEPADRPLRKSLSRGIVPVVGGNADLTAWLHRKFIGDPYASRKLKLLDTTREARVQLGATHRSEQRDRASELAQRNVETLWRATSDLAERKAALFALWDECIEGDTRDGEAGGRARAIVIGWIRAKLPAGSPGAFTVDEIAKLDASRSSQQHFAPYSEGGLGSRRPRTPEDPRRGSRSPDRRAPRRRTRRR